MGDALQKWRDEMTYIGSIIEKQMHATYKLQETVERLNDAVSGVLGVLEDIRDELKTKNQTSD